MFDDVDHAARKDDLCLVLGCSGARLLLFVTDNSCSRSSATWKMLDVPQCGRLRIRVSGSSSRAVSGRSPARTAVIEIDVDSDEVLAYLGHGVARVDVAHNTDVQTFAK